MMSTTQEDPVYLKAKDDLQALEAENQQILDSIARMEANMKANEVEIFGLREFVHRYEDIRSKISLPTQVKANPVTETIAAKSRLGEKNLQILNYLKANLDKKPMPPQAIAKALGRTSSKEQADTRSALKELHKGSYIARKWDNGNTASYHLEEAMIAQRLEYNGENPFKKK